MTRPLLFGAGGQVGTELVRQGDFEVVPRGEADLADPAACRRAILVRRPPVVVNAAAYTAVDRAEGEPDLAFAVNAHGPAALAGACAELGVPLVHLSTDYVFDGAKATPYREDDSPAPLSVYGASKLAGEQAIRARLDRHVILRTAWVFSGRRDNFIRTMHRLADRPELKVVDDQIGGPTAAAQVAEAVRALLAAIAAGRGRWGTFHFCGSPAVSRFQLAGAVFAALGRGPKLVPIATAAYPLPARRPANSMLDCRALEGAYGIPSPDWRTALPGALAQLEGKSP